MKTLTAIIVSILTFGWTYSMFIMAIGIGAPDGFLWLMFAGFALLYVPLGLLIYRDLK